MAITTEQLKNMSWPTIKIKDYEDLVYNEVWIADKELQKLLDAPILKDIVGKHFVYSNQRLLGYSKLLATSAQNLMTVILDLAYTNGQLDNTISIANAIKCIKANFITTIIVSKALEKVINKMKNYDDSQYTYVSGDFDIWLKSFIISTEEKEFCTNAFVIGAHIAKYKNNHVVSARNIMLNICNWWINKNIASSSIEELINNANIEVAISIFGKTIVEIITSLKDLPSELIRQITAQI